MSAIPPDFWQSLGIRFSDAVAGFAGGVVNAFVFKRSSPAAVIGSIVVGALTANYLGASALEYIDKIGMAPSSGATSFVVGLCAMAICQSIADLVAKWKPKINKDEDL